MYYAWRGKLKRRGLPYHGRRWRPCGRIFMFCKFWRKEKEMEPFDVTSENSYPMGSKKKKNVFSLLSADSRYFRIYAVKYAKLAAARVFKKATAALSNILNHEGHLLSRLFYNIAPNCWRSGYFPAYWSHRNTAKNGLFIVQCAVLLTPCLASNNIWRL